MLLLLLLLVLLLLLFLALLQLEKLLYGVILLEGKKYRSWAHNFPQKKINYRDPQKGKKMFWNYCTPSKQKVILKTCNHFG